MNQVYLKARRRETIKARVSIFLLGFITITAWILGNDTVRVFTVFLFFVCLLILATYFSYEAMGYRAFKKMENKLGRRDS
jgi:hypothetical protein